MLHIAYQNRDFKSQIEYTFDIMLSVYGIEYQIMDYSNLYSASSRRPDFVISYGNQKPPSLFRNHIHIYASDFFAEDYLKPASMPKASLKRHNDLPVIYAGYGEFDGLVKKSENLIETNIDIIASCFFMLSRYEEVIVGIRDEHQRFPAKASLAYKEGFLDRPIVNEYIELLWSWVHSLMPDLERKPFWPQNKEFAICLTHDVDALTRYSPLPPALSIGSAILRQKNPRLALSITWDYLGSLLHLKKAPLDYMLSLEQEYGFKSSFYFMAGGDSPSDANYSITRPKVRKLIQRIENGGCEVGLHASYDSYNNLEKIALEKGRLDKIVSNRSYGNRQHYLRWKTPDTWRIQEKASLLYDSTLSFGDHAGFRCGICLPFKPFDARENRILNIWELPLTVMDTSLLNPSYQNLSPEEGYKEIIRYVEMVRRFNGVFVLLWHKSSLYLLVGQVGWKKVYEKLMEYMSEQNTFVANGRAIIEWWRKGRQAV